MEEAERPTIDDLAAESGRYTRQAFELVQEALQAATEMVAKGKLGSATETEERREETQSDRFHITGQELLEGFRLYMRQTYGNLAGLLLSRSGLHSGEDVGAIVFLLVEAHYMGKRETDSPSDFAGGYDFRTAFAPSSLLE